ncbi:MAG TPA: hypothetical protein VII78_06305 [Myxococcota bacterium]|jgi:hypothetical protein
MSATTQEDWLRRDLARPRADKQRSLPLIPITLGVFIAYVALVALRGEIQRLAYELGASVQTEQLLLERERGAQVAVLRLRDPRRLRELAEARGFVVPERVIQLSREAARP